MYVVLNNTTGKKTTYTGHWPEDELEELLDKGEDIIVISHYSNTIKVPHKSWDSWKWKSYNL